MTLILIMNIGNKWDFLLMYSTYINCSRLKMNSIHVSSYNRSLEKIKLNMASLNSVRPFSSLWCVWFIIHKYWAIRSWLFCLQGTRTRKLEARKLREQKEEEEKQAIDLEEARFQAQKRKEAIEKAKTQQYYQTDRVKNFHVRPTHSARINK